MKLLEYADEEMLTIDLANTLAGELRAALVHEDRVLFVVPGGTTPGPIFDALCDSNLDWSRVDVMLSDERWVPEVHVRSNTRLIRERLLVGRAAAARQHDDDRGDIGHAESHQRDPRVGHGGGERHGDRHELRVRVALVGHHRHQPVEPILERALLEAQAGDAR